MNSNQNQENKPNNENEENESVYSEKDDGQHSNLEEPEDLGLEEDAQDPPLNQEHEGLESDQEQQEQDVQNEDDPDLPDNSENLLREQSDNRNNINPQQNNNPFQSNNESDFKAELNQMRRIHADREKTQKNQKKEEEKQMQQLQEEREFNNKQQAYEGHIQALNDSISMLKQKIAETSEHYRAAGEDLVESKRLLEQFEREKDTLEQHQSELKKTINEKIAHEKSRHTVMGRLKTTLDKFFKKKPELPKDFSQVEANQDNIDNQNNPNAQPIQQQNNNDPIDLHIKHPPQNDNQANANQQAPKFDLSQFMIDTYLQIYPDKKDSPPKPNKQQLVTTIEFSFDTKEKSVEFINALLTSDKTKQSKFNVFENNEKIIEFVNGQVKALKGYSPDKLPCKVEDIPDLKQHLENAFKTEANPVQNIAADNVQNPNINPNNKNDQPGNDRLQEQEDALPEDPDEHDIPRPGLG